MASGYPGKEGSDSNVFRLDVSSSTAPRAPVVLNRCADFTIGRLTVSPAPRQLLYVDDSRETLEPRVMEVFVALHRAGGAIVSRDDLMAACWRGTVVGEDAIQRVIQRLRKVADRSRAFRIETITKVGYRLQATDDVSPSAVTTPQKSAPASGLASKRQEWRWLAPAIVALMAIVAVVGWWAMRGPTVRDHTLAVLPATLSGDVPQALADEVQDSLLAALAQFGLPISTRADDLVARTRLSRVGSGYTLAVSFENRAAGTVLWTGTRTIAPGDPTVLRPIVREIAYILNCGKIGVDEAPASLDPKVLSLYLQYCDARAGKGSGSRRVQLGREMTAAAPDFSLAWLVIAEGEANAILRAPLTNENKHRTAGLEAVRRFNALRPNTSDGDGYAAILTDYRQPLERETLLRNASSERFIRCRCALEFLNDFLLQTGRATDALPFMRRALDQNTGDRIAFWRMFMTATVAGRQAEATRAYTQVLEISGGESEGLAKQLTLNHAIWTRNWRQAVALFDQFGRPPDPQSRAVRMALEALATHDPRAMARAAQAIEALPEPDRNDMQDLPLLAQLGAVDAVLARLEHSRVVGGDYAGPGRRPGRSQPLLFDPLLRPVYFDPRFGDFLKRAGFIIYWRQSRSKPDVCASGDAPIFCGAI